MASDEEQELDSGHSPPQATGGEQRMAHQESTDNKAFVTPIMTKERLTPATRGPLATQQGIQEEEAETVVIVKTKSASTVVSTATSKGLPQAAMGRGSKEQGTFQRGSRGVSSARRWQPGRVDHRFWSYKTGQPSSRVV